MRQYGTFIVFLYIMQVRKLWEYNNSTLFEVETFHHCPDQYNSWEEFINSSALKCNCIFGNPLLYWYWDNNDEWGDSEEEDGLEFSLDKKNFKRVVFIYRYWFSKIAKINILVKPIDEPQIREFIHKEQQTQTVSL